MAYDKKINAGDVAGKLLDALRQDKKNIEMDAVIKAEIDQASFNRAKNQIESLDGRAKVDIDTSKAERKLENLTDALDGVAKKIKNMANTNIEFNELHNAIKQYENLRDEINEVSKAIDGNNEAMVKSKRLIQETSKALEKLSVIQGKVKKEHTVSNVEDSITVSKKTTRKAKNDINDQIAIIEELDKAYEDVIKAKERVYRESSNPDYDLEQGLVKIQKKIISNYKEMLEYRKAINSGSKVSTLIAGNGKHTEIDNRKEMQAAAARMAGYYKGLLELGGKFDYESVGDKVDYKQSTINGIIGTINSQMRSYDRAMTASTKDVEKSFNKLPDKMKPVVEQQENLTNASKKTADAREKEAKATEKLAVARLKLTPKKEGNYTVPETYTALDGKYEVSKGKSGWDVYQRDSIGMYNLIGTYKTLKDVREDASLLTKEEIVVTEAATKAVEEFKNAYQAISENIRRIDTVCQQYVAILGDVKNEAISASDAIKKLNEFVIDRGFETKDAVEQVVESQNKLKFADGTILNDTQVAAVEKYCAMLKKSMGEAYNEARTLHQALQLVFDISSGNVANLMDRYHNGNPASNAVLKMLTGMDVKNQKNRDAALRSINPTVYDQIISEQQAAAEKAKAELKAQKSEFEKQWDEFVDAMIGGDAFKNESKLAKGKILKEFAKYANTAADAIHRINKAWLSGELEGKSGKTKNIQAYINHLDVQKDYFDSIRDSKAGDLDVDSLFELGGTTGMSEEKAAALRAEAAAWDELIAKKKEYYGITAPITNETPQVAPAIEETTVVVEDQAAEVKKLTSSYEGLADAVEAYVSSSKQQWEAYDKGEDFDKAAKERLDAVKQLTAFFPDKIMSVGNSDHTPSIYLEKQETSRKYAELGAEAMLKEMEASIALTRERREQAQLAQETVEQTEMQADAEARIAKDAEKAVNAKKKSRATRVQGDVDDEIEKLFELDTSKMIENIRNAAKEGKVQFLENIVDGQDLTNALTNAFRDAYNSIGEYKFRGKYPFETDGTTSKIKLISKDESKTLDYILKLEDGLVKIERAKQQIGTTSFNIADEVRYANAQVDNLVSKLKGRQLDGMSDLRDLANSIVDSESLKKFNTELEIMKKNVSTLSSNTVSNKGFNPLSNSIHEMENAQITIDTFRKQLNRLGDVDGVSQATEQLNKMTEAMNAFKSAASQVDEEKAFGDYSKAKDKYGAYYKYAQESKREADAQVKQVSESEQKIKEQYASILELINKINDASTRITAAQAKDGGTGVLAGYITGLQADKQKLIDELQGITQEINTTLEVGFVQGKEISVPWTQFLGGDSAISSFLNDTRTQASLTTEEIDKLVATLQKSQDIDVNAATKIAEQFKSVQETYEKLSSLSNLDQNNASYQAIAGLFAQIIQYKQALSSDPTSWTPEQSAHLQSLIDQFNKYGNVLVQVGQREAQYFSGKTKYTQDATIGNIAENATKEANQLLEVQQKLEQAARAFAQKSGAGDAFITGFTQSADGISKLDFSVFDAATNSLRNFRMEMGSVTEGMYVTETTVNKSLANIQAAQKQLQSVGSLLGKLNISGVSISEDNAPTQVSRLLELYKQLSAEINKGDNADQNKITALTNSLKLASSETEKLYKKMLQMDSAIANGDARSLGIGNVSGDVYQQLARGAEQLIGAQQGATLQFGRFNKATNTLDVSLVKTNGTVENFKLQMNQLNGQMTAQSVGVGKLTTSWDRFKSDIASVGKHFMTAFAGSNMFYKGLQQIRTGIGYVKEIDLAMTELKKVTNETDEAYEKFLDTAADTAGKIGSTVSDFTEATANFARLGYDMNQSAQMAEAATVYKNVADGIDDIGKATDSIISTMKAFGIESNDTMGIVDRFNEVKLTCLLIW